MHLAQLNIAKWKVDPFSEAAHGFMSMIDRVNAAAERMPGFQWRYNADASDPGKSGPFAADEMIVNMSVWETAEHLENFVWNTVHKRVYARKDEWFAHMKDPGFVMWMVEEGHRPTLVEAKERLDHLNANGNTDHAFGWSHLEHVKLWQTQRCG